MDGWGVVGLMGWVHRGVGGGAVASSDAFFKVVEISRAFGRTGVERVDYRGGALVASVSIGVGGRGLGTVG